MACVILIHAKNWQERNRVLGCLDDDISSEVIVDLKKYVEEKYKGKFVKDEEDDGDSTQMEAIEPVENKDIPLLAAMAQNDQMNGTGSNALASMNTVVREEDGYGTFIPYRDRMVEPKEENVVIQTVAGNDIPVVYLDDTDQLVANMEDGDTVGEQSTSSLLFPPDFQLLNIAQNEQVLTDVADSTDIPLIAHSPSVSGNIENDLHADGSEAPVTARRSTRSMKRGRIVIENEDEDAQKGNTKSSNVDNVPSTSTVRRSGRVAKRPAYSMDDKDGEDDDPVSMKVSSTPRNQVKKGENDERSVETGIECKKCSKQLSAKFRQYSNAKQHAILHTDLKRYECPVNGCVYKCVPYHLMQYHTQTKHGRLLPAQKINLTTEQEEELDQMTKECFPVFGARDEYKTCAVCQVVVSNNSLDQYHLKRHLLQHIDFMLCANQSKCQYETKHYPAMIEHGRKKHDIEEMSKEETGIELTDDQKKMIDDMFKKCFPITDINNTVTTLIECKKCMKKLNTDHRCYSHAKDHAIGHTDLKRYECPVDGCDYKCGRSHTIRDHVRLKHGNRKLPTRKIDLTDEQEEELDRITKECFPVFGTSKLMRCSRNVSQITRMSKNN